MKHFRFLILLLSLFQIISSYGMKMVGGIDFSTDREALLAFKSLVFDPQNALSGWNINSSHCTWFGVNCTSNGTQVQSLSLTSLGLFGNIPPRLSNLTSLKTLNLSNNFFFGQIPSELGRLTSLQSIILATNNINGTIPISLSDCLMLEQMSFGNNKLTGLLPSELGQLPRLKILDVSMNNLTGAIPSTFGNLSTMTNLSIARTNISGKIPNELGRLHNLVMLQLSENQLSGEIPFSIFNISSLKFLSLTENRLVGKLPSNIGLTLPNIRELHLGGNSLEGPIPSSLSNASHIEILDLPSNNFTGPIPLLGNLKNLAKLILGLNKLSSTTEQNFQVFGSLTKCTKLEYIFLNSNQLAGELPSSVANLSFNLQQFCIDDNLLTGSFPQGFERYQNLLALSIQQNSFRGQIPKSIGKLQKLEKLHVHENLFSGEIPDIFSNLTRLFELYMGNNQLSGRIPMSIATCQLLEKLVLAGTAVNGSIPKQIFELPQLKFLILANNTDEDKIMLASVTKYLDEVRARVGDLEAKIIQIPREENERADRLAKAASAERMVVPAPSNTLSGSLPYEFGHLRQCEIMDISGNQLSGYIPAITERYLSLRRLNIARNKITGSLPKSLEYLAALESLDLSSNNLSGLIPKELQNLHVLEMLNLSFNNFEGDVPKNGVFAKISWDSLQGNSRLCAFDHDAAEKLRVNTCITKKKSNSHLVLKVTIPISAIIVLVSALCLVWALITKKKSKIRNNGTSSSVVRGLTPRLSYSEIHLGTNGFATENLLGKGAFGSVYKAVFSTGENGTQTTVAVKVLDLTQSKASKSFDAECEALRNIRHRNLVKVFTSCSSIDHTGAAFKALAMEFMSNGNLDKWLYPEDVECGSTLTLTQRLNISIDVATALDYLHYDCDPAVAHCDLKPGNVLLDEDMTAHVGDFGLARFLSHDSSQNESSTIGLKGSIGYIAPEYGLAGKASTSGDVYSFGILLLEMIIAKKPTDRMFQEGLSLNKFISEVHESKILDIADPRLFKDYESVTRSSSTGCSIGGDSSSNNNNNIALRSEKCVAAMVGVGLSCVAHSSKERFTMREALSKLQEIKRSFIGS
ncbi:probable LRR receptor-like serine/threonine-protein kinase At3g47570 [Quercus robur]|uniref:probable LRR receptor-like serine/threonine-protein kinase At3g47570 n=1 Tax=Quercus robur TaxID=38942 RepID=UPI0021620B39|nr:probable LRR receptor-like serine/threonine-protein kinase At3g47570 [Quercus robur]